MRWLMVLVLVLVGETLGGPVAVPAPFPAGVGPVGTKYKTAYKCEGSSSPSPVPPTRPSKLSEQTSAVFRLRSATGMAPLI